MKEKRSPGFCNGFAVTIFTVAPNPPVGESARAVFITSSELTPSDDKFSKLNERVKPVPAIWRPLSVTKLNDGPKPRTVIWLPSPFERLTDTPVIRCNDSAKFVSGNLPISSAEMASTTPEASRFTSIERINDPRIPFTSMISSSGSAVFPSAA